MKIEVYQSELISLSVKLAEIQKAILKLTESVEFKEGDYLISELNDQKDYVVFSHYAQNGETFICRRLSEDLKPIGGFTSYKSVRHLTEVEKEFLNKK